MKQLLQDLRTGKTLLVDTPAPSPAPGQVLVHVAASAVSPGTERMLLEFAQKSLVGKARARPDLMRQVINKARRDGLAAVWETVQGRLEEPLPLGYSCAGTVVEAGPGVETLLAGARVACAGAGHANHAEFVCVPENLCAALPSDGAPSFEEAAFGTLAAIAMQGFRLGEPSLGESVAVIGLGLLGQLSAQIAAAAGCKVIGIDIDPGRVALADSLGLDAGTLRDGAEQAAKDLTAGRGVDLVLICADGSSNDPIELAAALARDRGTVVAVGAVGLAIPRNAFFRKELSLKVSRSYGPGRYDPSYEEHGLDYPYGYVRWTENRNLAEAIRLMAAGKLRVAPLVTHRLPIDRGPEAYDLIGGVRREPSLGIVLTYPSQAEPMRRVSLPETVSPSQEKVRIGVLGAGAFSSAVLLPVIARGGGELRGISSAAGLRARTAARRFGFAFAASDQNEVLRDPRANAIAILTRHDLHAAQVQAALSAGKHVFVEKPLCLTPAELEAIEAVHAKTPGLVVTVDFNRRFAPYTQELIAFFRGIRAPKVIEIRVNAGTLPEGHWLLDPVVGGGRLLGEGCHFIDWACFVAGSPPLNADCQRIGDAVGEGDWSLRLRYPDGSVAHILYLSAGHPGVGKERYEVHAGGVSAVIDDFKTLRLFGRSGTEVRRSWLRSDKGHAGHWKAFRASVESAAAPPIPWGDIVGTARATFAAQESRRAGGAQRVAR